MRGTAGGWRPSREATGDDPPARPFVALHRPAVVLEGLLEPDGDSPDGVGAAVSANGIDRQAPPRGGERYGDWARGPFVVVCVVCVV